MTPAAGRALAQLEALLGPDVLRTAAADLEPVQQDHRRLYHGRALASYKRTAAALVILCALFLLLPLLALDPVLAAARGRAIPAYGALVGEQGRLVQRRLMLREPRP